MPRHPPHRLEGGTVAAGGGPRQHARHDALGEQVAAREGAVGCQWHLGRAVDRAYPRARDGQASTTQGHPALLGATAGRGAGPLVLAPGTGDLGHLGRHEFVHDVEPDRHRGCQQTLAEVFGEAGQVALDARGQPFGQLAGAARQQLRVATIASGPVSWWRGDMASGSSLTT